MLQIWITIVYFYDKFSELYFYYRSPHQQPCHSLYMYINIQHNFYIQAIHLNVQRKETHQIFIIIYFLYIFITV